MMQEMTFLQPRPLSGDNGEAVLKVHEVFAEEMPGSPVAFPMEVKAIMHRSNTDGGLTKYAYYGAWQGRHQIWT